MSTTKSSSFSKMETFVLVNPHAFIMSILQTVEFASFTKIGLCTFGTHFASICNLSNFAATFFNVVHDLCLISLMVFIRITIWSWHLGPFSQVEGQPNVLVDMMRKWYMFTSYKKNPFGYKRFPTNPQTCKCTHPLIPPNLTPLLQIIKTRTKPNIMQKIFF